MAKKRIIRKRPASRAIEAEKILPTSIKFSFQSKGVVLVMYTTQTPTGTPSSSSSMATTDAGAGAMAILLQNGWVPWETGVGIEFRSK